MTDQNRRGRTKTRKAISTPPPPKKKKGDSPQWENKSKTNMPFQVPPPQKKKPTIYTIIPKIPYQVSPPPQKKERKKEANGREHRKGGPFQPIAGRKIPAEHRSLASLARRRHRARRRLGVKTKGEGGGEGRGEGRGGYHTLMFFFGFFLRDVIFIHFGKGGDPKETPNSLFGVAPF